MWIILFYNSPTAVNICRVVFNHNLFIYIEFLVVTPHLASATRFARDGIARIAAENVLRGLAGEPMVAPVP